VRDQGAPATRTKADRRAAETEGQMDATMRAKLANAYAQVGDDDEAAARILLAPPATGISRRAFIPILLTSRATHGRLPHVAQHRLCTAPLAAPLSLRETRRSKVDGNRQLAACLRGACWPSRHDVINSALMWASAALSLC
jgi:hypothetical protein